MQGAHFSLPHPLAPAAAGDVGMQFGRETVVSIFTAAWYYRFPFFQAAWRLTIRLAASECDKPYV